MMTDVNPEPDPYPPAQIERELETRREARTVAGPEILPDGGEFGEAELREGETREDDQGHAGATNEILKAHADEVDWPALHVGDHVTDREDDDSNATLLVVGVPPVQADERDAGGKTVAEWNPEYPADDDVVEVIYPQRTDVDVTNGKRYSFPRSRLRLETPIHSRDENDGGEE